MATSFTTRGNKEVKIGDKVGFKLDHEGRGRVVKINEHRDFMGTHTTVIIAIQGHSHFGYERYDFDVDSYVVEAETDQVW